MRRFDDNAPTNSPAYESTWESEDTDTLDALLRGEISAAETYDLAISKFEGHAVLEELRRIRDEHHAAMSMFWRPRPGERRRTRRFIRCVGHLRHGSHRHKARIGNEIGSRALQQGEEHGISAYQKAVNAEKSPETVAR